MVLLMPLAQLVYLTVIVSNVRYTTRVLTLTLAVLISKPATGYPRGYGV